MKSVHINEARVQPRGTIGEGFIKAFKEKFDIDIIEIEAHNNDLKYGTGEVWFTIKEGETMRKVHGTQGNFSWSISE